MATPRDGPTSYDEHYRALATQQVFADLDPELIARALATQQVFTDLGPELIARVAKQATRIFVPGGTFLFEEGAPSDALFVIISGALTAERKASPEGATVKLGDLFAGETVGEMGVLTGDARSASVRALRDSELIRVSGADLIRIVQLSPNSALALARVVARRLALANLRADVRHRPKSFAIVPHPALDGARDFAARLHAACNAHGATVVIDAGIGEGRPVSWFHEMEAAHRHVLYLADATASTWTRTALRQADVLVLAIDRGAACTSFPALETEEAIRWGRRRYLVLIDCGRLQSCSSSDWIAVTDADFACHLATPSDEARLARLLLGRALGVAFSGGGARGFAHVGMIRALAETGIRPDVFVGVSMGAVVAACFAAGWSYQETVDRMRSAFVDHSPIGDFALPWIALFKGRRVERLLHRAFGDVKIEDLPHPFACVSTNLATASSSVHQRGSLVAALRASTSIPGVFQPVMIDGDAHVDGGVLDNLPLALLRGFDLGPVVGLHVQGTGSTALHSERSRPPRLLEVLLYASTITGTASPETYRSLADLYLRVSLPSISMLSWKNFDRAVTLGYEEAKPQLHANKEALDLIRA